MTTERAIPLIIKISLFIVYLVDGFTKYLQNYSNNYNFWILPNRFVKVLMVLFTVVYALLIFKRAFKAMYNIYIYLFILFTIFLFNKILYGVDYDYFIRYSCFFFFAPVFFLKVEEESWTKNVSLTLKYLVYINLFFIICGVITDFQLFKSYHSRFGYDGLLLTPMQSTYFYISSIAIAIKLKDKAFLIVGLISSLLVGTKILLGFLVSVGFYLTFTKIKNTKLRIIIVGTLLSSFIVIFFAFFNQKPFKEIIDSEGVLSAIFSHRNSLLVSTWNNLSEINFNIITGGIDLEIFRVEMEIIDVLMCLGVLGFIVFFAFFKLLKNAFVVDKLSLFYFIVVLFFMIIGGNFLYYPINCFVFLITLKSLSLRNK